MGELELHNPFSALSGGMILEAAAMLLVFVVVLFAGSILIPGRRIEMTDSEGTTRTYRLNGLALFLIVAVVACLAQFFGWFSLATLYTHFVALFVVTNVFAIGLSAWLYWGASRNGKALPESQWGFLMGRDLNPVWFGMDLKMFSYRPSLIGLAMFNASFAAVQYETYGELTLAMTLYQAFFFVYVFNYFQFEHGMIHTWDIVSERFGWNLVWGDYVLVPFFLLHRRLVAGASRGPAAVTPRRRRDRAAVRIRFLAVPGRQSAEAPFQAEPRHQDLGETGPNAGRAPAGLGILGHRAAPQLHR